LIRIKAHTNAPPQDVAHAAAYPRVAMETLK